MPRRTAHNRAWSPDSLDWLTLLVQPAPKKKTTRTRPLQNAAIPARCLPAVEYLVRILPQPTLGLGTSIPTSPDSLTASSQGLLFTYQTHHLD